MSDLFGTPSQPSQVTHRPPAPGPIRRASAVSRDEAHLCRVCGRWGGFGFGSLRQGRVRWACRDHRDEVERMAG